MCPSKYTRRKKGGLPNYIIENKKKRVDNLRRVVTPPSALPREYSNENTQDVSLKKEYNITKNEKSFYFLTKGDHYVDNTISNRNEIRF